MCLVWGEHHHGFWCAAPDQATLKRLEDTAGDTERGLAAEQAEGQRIAVEQAAVQRASHKAREEAQACT